MPGGGVVKGAVPAVDLMGADMAGKRLGDLSNDEVYGLIEGHDRKKIQSVSPALTGLTVTYGGGLSRRASADPRCIKFTGKR